MLKIYCVEDEMITIHRDGKYMETIFASCPEQANDFKKLHAAFEDGEDLNKKWEEFKAKWKSKYSNEDGY